VPEPDQAGEPMTTRRLGFFGSCALWIAGFLVFAITIHATGSLARGAGRDVGQLLYLVPGWIGVLIPFVVFAGGVSSSTASTVSIVRRAVLVAAASYFLLAYAGPVLKYRVGASSGVDVSAVYPFGPETPGGLLAHRSAVREGQPEEFSFEVGRPMDFPPNWITYLIHSPVALALFTLFSTLLGHRIGRLTTGLSPPVRRDTRWALGVVSGVAFFLGMMGGEGWVQADPAHSAILGAWLPLLIPGAALAITELLIRRREAPGA
jgi:hypothetical protein